MRPIKGLNLDNRPLDIPEGFSSFCSNVVYRNGVLENELGFEDTGVILPYYLVGVVNCDKGAVLFTTNDTLSEIGFFDYETKKYRTIVNDSSLSYKFGFNKQYPIKGEFQRNYKGELIVAFRDSINNPRIINIDNNKAVGLNDYLLFPEKKRCTIKYFVTENGTLEKGNYTPVVRYIKDGVYTDFFVYGRPISIGDKNNGSIDIILTDLDNRYKQVQVAFIQIKEGVSTVVTSFVKDISETVRINYSGSYKNELGLEEVLEISPYYIKAKAIGLHNDELFLAGLEEYNMDKIDYFMQTTACGTELLWRSDLVQDVVKEGNEGATGYDMSNYKSVGFINDINYLSGKYKTFMHQEVYSFYLRAHLKNGYVTKAYTIPGRAFINGDKDYNGLVYDEMKYQVEDTIPTDVIGGGDNLRTRKFGFWENQNETYPNKEIAGYGNPFGSLAGQKVRHHKFPSHSYCYNNLGYNLNSDYGYGVTSLDVLSVVVNQFQIPSEIADIVDKVELCYAKRNQIDITNLGQSIYLCGARPSGLSDFKDTTSTGGNFHYGGYGIDDVSDYLKLDESALRFHSYDMLINNIAVKPKYLQTQLKLKKSLIDLNKTFNREGILNNSTTTSTEFNDLFKERSLYQVIDYVTGNRPIVSSVSNSERFNKILDFKRLPANTYTGDFDNRLLEGCFVGKLKDRSGSNIIAIETAGYTTDQATAPLYKQTISGAYDWVYPNEYELTFLSNAIRAVDDVFLNYDNQELITTGYLFTNVVNTLGSPNIIAGDGFVSDYSFVTYGKRSSRDNAKAENQGARYIHRFLCETASNANLRYETIGDDYTKSYPKNDGTWITSLDKSIEPNNSRYDKEFGKLNDYEAVLPLNLTSEPLYSFPYRIIRSSPNNKEKGQRTWQNFSALDYYELEKSYGSITNISSLDDKLVIHTEKSVFVTREKARLDTDILKVVLGSGDIFEFNPLKLLDYKDGYGGLSKDVSMLSTPIGYVFVDSIRKTPFIYKENLKSIGNACSTFFLELLKKESINPYLDKGIVFGYDSVYRRILMTYKNETESFTMSYSVDLDNWVSFHDYIADAYLQGNNEIFSIKGNRIYTHNIGLSGRYYSQEEIKPSIIDVPFVLDKEEQLISVNWISDSVVNRYKGEGVNEMHTFDIISARTNFEHTGEIKLYRRSWLDKNYNKVGVWFSTNELYNIVERNGKGFIKSIIDKVEFESVDTITDWFRRELLRNNFFVVRFKTNNETGKNISLLEVAVNSN